MKFHQPLDEILNSGCKVRMLRLFCRTEVEINGRQLAKLLKISPTTSHKELKELLEARMIDVRGMGRVHSYSLNKENLIVSQLLFPLFKEESKLWENIKEIIKSELRLGFNKKDILSVALFGSVYEKKETPMSDIDLFIVVQHGTVKKEVEEFVAQIDKRLFAKTNTILSPYVLSLNEFKKKYKANLAVVKSILDANEIILGKELRSLL